MLRYRLNRDPLLMFLVIAVALVFSASASAQSRRRARISSLRRPGSTGIGLSSFRSHSYGLGGASAARYSAPTGVLSRSASLNIRRTGSPLGTRSGGSSLRSLLSGTRTGLTGAKPLNIKIDRVPRRRLGTSLSPMSGVGAADDYVTAISGIGQNDLAREITSLAVDDKSRYSQEMRKGEELFKEGEFLDAYNHFKMANIVGQRDPESLLSMMHAQVALSHVSYGLSAFYLEKALESLPELPALNMSPKKMYGREQYDYRIGRLRKYLEKNPRDNEAQLVNAYFLWFEGEHEQAKKALNQAKVNSNSPHLAEAAETFLDAIEAVGSEATTQPAQEASAQTRPTTAPAELPGL